MTYAKARSLNVLPVIGEVFSVNGYPAFLILPKQINANFKTPWVWYAPTLPGLPRKEDKWMFQKFKNAGIAVAGIDVGESYGNPQGRAAYSAFYKKLVSERGLSKKPCLLAISRGGLMLYNWAIEHPTSVAGVAGIYPVVSLSSYPGLSIASLAYGMTEEQLTVQLSEHNPIDRMVTLANACVPIYHIHGDRDTVVPLEENTGLLAKRYIQLAGEMRFDVIKGQGHNMADGFFQNQNLVNFVITQSTRGGLYKLDATTISFGLVIIFVTVALFSGFLVFRRLVKPRRKPSACPGL